jgi:hypothetical protein
MHDSLRRCRAAQEQGHEQTAVWACTSTRLQAIFCQLLRVCDLDGGGPGLSLLQRLGLAQDLLRCDLQAGREEEAGVAVSGGGGSGGGRASGGGGQGSSVGRRRG